jgi:hypothetical protein
MDLTIGTVEGKQDFIEPRIPQRLNIALLGKPPAVAYYTDTLNPDFLGLTDKEGQVGMNGRLPA